MAYPVVESVSSTITDTDASSIVVTKPTGLAEGDLMVAFLGLMKPGSNVYPVIPTGWSALTSDEQSSSSFWFKSYYKIADATDVAASNFTFTWTGPSSDKLGASIHRISGIVSDAIFGDFSNNEDLVRAGSSVTYPTSVTPLTDESLVLTAFYVSDATISSPITGVSYSTTPPITFTEDIDHGVRDGSSDGMSIFVASGEYAGTTEITEYGAVYSNDATYFGFGIIIVINAEQDASGTTALHAIAPTVNDVNATASASGTTALLEISPTLPTQSGEGTTPTRWNKETKESTTWTEPTK